VRPHVLVCVCPHVVVCVAVYMTIPAVGGGCPPLSSMVQVAAETISSVQYVRAFGKEEKEKRRFAESVGAAFALGKVSAPHSLTHSPI